MNQDLLPNDLDLQARRPFKFQFCGTVQFEDLHLSTQPTAVVCIIIFYLLTTNSRFLYDKTDYNYN